jgi:tripartite ATP-independent transporter DctM subunit
MVSLALIFGFMFFMGFGVPVSMALGLATLLALVVSGNTGFLFVIPQQMVEGVDHPSLVAIPFFLLAGNLMNVSGLTDKIFNFAAACIGHVRGGLAQVNVLSNMVMAGISGAAVADCAGLGVIAVPAMEKRGYTRPFAAAITVAAAVIGPIIPPSIPFVIYAYMAETSVGRMFLAGIVPGIIIGIGLITTNYLLSFRYNFPKEPRAPLKEVFRTGLQGIAALVAPLIIIGSILTGVVTANESGALAALYVLLQGLLYRTLNWQKIWLALRDTAIMTTVIMFIIGFSTAIGWLFAFEQAPHKLAGGLLSITTNKYVFLFLLLIFLLILGCVLEGIPAMLITLPFLLPLADQFGIDRVHFGLIICYGILIGIATPPMGIGLYIMVEVAKVSFEEIVVAVLPFVVTLTILLLLFTYVPSITTFLPNLLMGAP